MALRQRISRILDESIVPFWQRATVTVEHGCHIEFDARGTPLPPGNRTAVSQAQMLLFFSLLARRGNEGGALDKAATLFAYLRERLLDREYGGYFWDTDAATLAPNKSGDPRAAAQWTKHLLAQAAALHAVSEYARTSGSSAARAAAGESFDLILTAGRPDANGVFTETLDRCLTPAGPEAWSPLGPYPAIHPTHGTHLHILEAFDAYRRLVADRRSIEQTERMIAMLETQAYTNRGNGACRFADAFDKHGRRVVSVGHGLEEIGFCLAAELGMRGDVVDLDAYATAYRELAAVAYDRRHGGFQYSLGESAERTGRRKLWWVQAEALACSLHLAVRAGDSFARDTFLGTLDWVEGRQIDWRHGGWHAVAGRFFTPRQAKGDIWKTAYHEGRAMFDCLALLDRPTASGSAFETHAL